MSGSASFQGEENLGRRCGPWRCGRIPPGVTQGNIYVRGNFDKITGL
jgi:hypothetical protein